jgi:hypothetical protein
MSQDMQNSPKLPMGIQPLMVTESEEPLAQVKTLKIVSCPTCQAVYIPSSRQQAAAPGSMTLLETAFLSLCHFCFRCQRPACPQCWNPMHCVCAACSEEALLPFRSPVPSLEGLIFSPQPSTQMAQTVALSFTCLRNGRFYVPEPATRQPSLEQNQASSPASSYPITSTELPIVQIKHDPPAQVSSSPSWIQEITGQKPDAQVPDPPSAGQWSNNAQMAGPLSFSAGQRSNNARPWSAQTRPIAAATQPSQPQQPQTGRPLPQIPAPPALMTHSRATDVREMDDGLDEDDISLFERIENVLIVVVSSLLLVIVLMIVLAISSSTMNAFFLHLLHIDIRTEILYLLQLR